MNAEGQHKCTYHKATALLEVRKSTVATTAQMLMTPK